jgi:uncharacterized protein with HEPN domain
MSKRDDTLLVEDILVSIQKIHRYTSSLSEPEFRLDEKTVDAVIRNFEIIGEASNRLSEPFKVNHPDIPWHHLRGFRNRVVHEYFGVDLSIVWSIIENDLEDLENKIKSI